LPSRVEALQAEIKKLQAQHKKGAAADLASVIDKLMIEAPEVNGTKLIAATLPEGTSPDAVRTQIDRIRQKLGSAFIVFGWSEAETGRVPLVAALTNDLVKRGLKAGEVVKQVAAIVGGSGGGKPDFAQAGGKDANKLPDAIEMAEKLGRKLLGKQ
jgi:alanyl-tRNA synthetase